MSPTPPLFLARLRELWRRVDVMREPKAQLLEIIEAQ
jgi:hypothetical protein